MEETLITYPSSFPVKIMGEDRDDFSQTILAIVLRHAPDFDPASMEKRPSKAGKYMGLTCTITATSRGQLDALYQELTACPLIKLVL